MRTQNGTASSSISDESAGPYDWKAKLKTKSDNVSGTGRREFGKYLSANDVVPVRMPHTQSARATSVGRALQPAAPTSSTIAISRSPSPHPDLVNNVFSRSTSQVVFDYCAF